MCLLPWPFNVSDRTVFAEAQDTPRSVLQPWAGLLALGVCDPRGRALAPHLF